MQQPDRDNSLSWCNDQAITYNPEQVALAKHISELTVDEAIVYRANDFFPDSDDKRKYNIAARVDGAFLRSLNIVTRSHPKTIRGNNQYIALCLGNMIISDRYAESIAEIIKKFDAIESGIDDYLYARTMKRAPIEQAGTLITQRQIGLTMAQRDKFDHLAEQLGLNQSGFFLVCFWAGITTSQHLPEHITAYGLKIDDQFKNHLKSRQYELNFTP